MYEYTIYNINCNMMIKFNMPCKETDLYSYNSMYVQYSMVWLVPKHAWKPGPRDSMDEGPS